jgi:hypothetical protein
VRAGHPGTHPCYDSPAAAYAPLLCGDRPAGPLDDRFHSIRIDRAGARNPDAEFNLIVSQLQADELSEDPLHSFLIFLKLFADTMRDLPNGHPGCLIASYIYQDHLFSRDVRNMTTEGHLIWRKCFGERLARIAEHYPPKIEVNLDDMADMLSAVADGGIILSKSLKDPSALPRQILHSRCFVRAVFLGA